MPGCANGRKQRKVITNYRASSPTISIEALFLIVTKSEKELLEVATMDICVAFMQTELNGENIHITFQGRVVELLAMITQIFTFSTS